MQIPKIKDNIFLYAFAMDILCRIIFLLISFTRINYLYLNTAMSCILMIGVGYILGKSTINHRKLISCILSLAVFDGLLKGFETLKFSVASLDIKDGFVLSMVFVTTLTAFVSSFLFFRLGALIGFKLNKRRLKNAELA